MCIMLLLQDQMGKFDQYLNFTYSAINQGQSEPTDFTMICASEGQKMPNLAACFQITFVDLSFVVTAVRWAHT